MEFQQIIYTKENQTATITLNRPAKLNAYSEVMVHEIIAALADARDDDNTRAVIVTGAGRGFCAGGDISPDFQYPARYRGHALESMLEMRENMHQLVTFLRRFDKPTVAAINGPAVAGGLTLALCCDFRIAGENAWFSIPEVELGIPLSWNALPRLAREVGHARALEMTVVCERFSAQQALDWGLVTHVVPTGKELDAARELAAKIVAKPPLPVALTKASMKAIKRQTEQGDVAYSDGDLLLYSRLLQQRARRRAQRDEA